MIQDNKKVKYRYSDTKGFSHLYVTTAGYYEEGFAGLALFMEDLRKRKDIHKKIKDELMDNDWSRGIVYYPVYSVYTIGTYTRKYTSHHSDGIYDGHTKIGSVNYSVDNVTSRSGVKKSSKKMKSRFDELALDPCRVLHLEESEEVSKQQDNIYIYAQNLYMSDHEMKQLARDVAKDGEDRKTSHDITYYISMFLVPIERYLYEYKGKILTYEVNLNNGNVISKNVPQKISAKLLKACLYLINLFIRIAMLFLPIFSIVCQSSSELRPIMGTIDSGIMTLLFFAINVILVIASLVIAVNTKGKSEGSYDLIVRFNKGAMRGLKIYFKSLISPTICLVIALLIFFLF